MFLFSFRGAKFRVVSNVFSYYIIYCRPLPSCFLDAGSGQASIVGLSLYGSGVALRRHWEMEDVTGVSLMLC